MIMIMIMILIIIIGIIIIIIIIIIIASFSGIDAVEVRFIHALAVNLRSQGWDFAQ